MAKRKKAKEPNYRPAYTNETEVLQPTIQIEDETVRDILTRSKEFYNKKRKYPDELKILAITLRSAGYNLKQIAGIIGASHNRIGEWCHSPHLDNHDLSRLADGIKERMSSHLLINSQTSFSAAMKDEKLEKASYLQLVTGGSIMIDKHRLLNEQSSSIVEHIYIKKDELGDKRTELNGEIIDIEADIAQIENELIEDEEQTLTLPAKTDED